MMKNETEIQAGERTQMPSQSEMDHAAEAMTATDFNAWLDECRELVSAHSQREQAENSFADNKEAQ